jgi:hypothetical protein
VTKQWNIMHVIQRDLKQQEGSFSKQWFIISYVIGFKTREISVKAMDFKHVYKGI